MASSVSAQGDVHPPVSFQPQTHESMDEIARKLGVMLRKAYKDNLRVVEEYRLVVDRTNEETVSSIASSQRSWIPLIGKIAAASTAFLGGVVLGTMSEDVRKSWSPFVNTFPELASAGINVRSNYQEADRTLLQSVSENSRSISSDASRKIQEIFSQLSEELQALRKLDEERAQMLKAMSR